MRWVIRQGLLEDFPAQAEIKMEPTVSAGRLDLLLTHMGQRHYIETKSVNLIDRTGMARFPDAPTARGRRHLEELIRLRQLGYRSSLVFVNVRHDALGMAPFNERDPAFGQALTAAFQAGVELLALKFKVGASIQYAGKIPLELEPEPFPGYWPRLLP
jgi:sugar fermentation stimulation protein A